MSEPITEGKVVRIVYGLVAETGQPEEDCRNWRAKSEQENTWTTFQAHFNKSQADLQEFQKTSRKGGYHTSTAYNSMEIPISFTNMEQAMVEDRSAVTNLTMANITLTEQVALYDNRLSIKEADNMELQTSMKNI